jgi:uncharacterized linocin/CFP29 family protein
MNPQLQIAPLTTSAGRVAVLGGRPTVNKRSGIITIQSARGMTINSALRKNEWEELDRQVVAAAIPPLRLLNILVSRGLTRTLGSLGTIVAQYNAIGEMTAANATIRGHASVEKDLIDVTLAGVPVPVIAKEFEIDERFLQASRMLGDGLDVANAAAAARVVAEKMEDMLINGDTSLNLLGQVVYGLTTHPARTTNTATGFGGGVWSAAIDNAVKTIAGMIGALQAKGFYGPYGVFASTNQFNTSALTYYSDGSGDTPRDRILRMANVAVVEQIPQLADGVILVVQLDSNTVQAAYVPGYFPSTVREWMSGDGMLNSFKVMAVYTPIIKAAVGSNKLGVAHATGA